MARRSLAILLFCAAAGLARAEWRIVDARSQGTASAAVTYWAVQLQEDATEQSARIHLAIFDSRKATLRIFDQPSEPRRRLAEIMRQHQCVAGVNGGYFHPDYRAVGLLLSDGRTIAPMQKARLLSGVLAVAKDRVQLLRSSEIPKKRAWVEARQAGPFLVDRGRAVSGLNDTRAARRTFVATDAGRAVAIGSSSAVSLAQLGRILAGRGVAGEMEIDRALNLDGGSSSAFWCTRASSDPVRIPESKTVRDVIGVVEK